MAEAQEMNEQRAEEVMKWVNGMDGREMFEVLVSDGLRGELTLLRALRALCAFNGSTKPTLDNIREIAIYTLSHRLRRDPLDDTSSEVRVKRKVNELIDGK